MEIVNGNVKTIDSTLQGLKALETKEDGRIIEGYFTTKDPDRGGDITLPTAFTKTMKVFKGNPIVTFMHDWKKPIGNMLDYKIDEKGVWVKIKVAEGVQWVDDIWSLVKQKVIRALSYGYRIVDSAKIDIDGRDYKQLKEVELLEIAVVTIPMNASALFTTSEGKVKAIDIRRGGSPSEEAWEQPDIPDVKEIKFDIEKYTSEEAYQLVNKISSSVKHFYTNDSYHVFEFYEGVSASKELCGNLKDGVTFTVVEKEEPVKKDTVVIPPDDDETKGVLQDTLDEKEKKRASNLCALWGICYANLIKIDLEAQKDAKKKSKELIDEFAIIAKGKALEFIKYQQEFLQEMERDRPILRSLKEMKVEELAEVLEELNSKTNVSDNKAGRVLSATNRTLISNCVGSMGKAGELLKSLLDMADNTTSADDGKQRTKEEKEEEKSFLMASIASITEEMDKIVKLYSPPSNVTQ